MKLLVLLVVLVALRYLHVPRAMLARWFGAYMHMWLSLLGKQRWFNGLGGVSLIAFVAAIIVNAIASLPAPINLIVHIAVVLIGLCVTDSFCPNFSAPNHAKTILPNINPASVPSELWQMNYRWITPLFWYLLLGPLGLIFYVSFLYAAFCHTCPAWQTPANRVFEMAAWIPSRITSLAFAFAGELTPTLKLWSEHLMMDSQYNHVFLIGCAMAARPNKAEGATINAYHKLLRDSAILLLGLFAIVSMIFMVF